MCDCCVGREHVIVVRSPHAAVTQPHKYTVNGTKSRAWGATTVVLLLLYITAAVLLHTYCCTDFVAASCEAHRLLLKKVVHRFFFNRFLCAYNLRQHTHRCIYRSAHA